MRKFLYAAVLLLLPNLAHAATATASSSSSSSSTGGVTVDLVVTGNGTASGSASVTVNGVTHFISHTLLGPGSFHGHDFSAARRDSRR
jgi:hypothetical protein